MSVLDLVLHSRRSAGFTGKERTAKLDPSGKDIT